MFFYCLKIVIFLPSPTQSRHFYYQNTPITYTSLCCLLLPLLVVTIIIIIIIIFLIIIKNIAFIELSRRHNYLFYYKCLFSFPAYRYYHYSQHEYCVYFRLLRRHFYK